MFYSYARLDQHGSAIKIAVLNTIEKHQIRTPDIGGTSTTTQFIDLVLSELIEMTPELGFNYEMQQISKSSPYKNLD